MSRFETETVADLMWQQGHGDEAIALCLRLAAKASGDERRRLTDKAGAWRDERPRRPSAKASPAGDVDATTPSVSLTLRRSSVALTWSLPRQAAGPGSSPAAELFLARQGREGVDVQRRMLPLGGTSGTLELPVSALHSARVAVGFLETSGFRPLARSTLLRAASDPEGKDPRSSP